jgi:hypothetical protein
MSNLARCAAMRSGRPGLPGLFLPCVHP